jgi:hypothetical protein
VFDTGQGRKTDPVDAHSVAVAALCSKGLRQVTVDDVTVALRLLADRRDGLGHARTDLLNRIHKLLLELLPGGAKKYLSAPQARALLNTIHACPALPAAGSDTRSGIRSAGTCPPPCPTGDGPATQNHTSKAKTGFPYKSPRQTKGRRRGRFKPI